MTRPGTGRGAGLLLPVAVVLALVGALLWTEGDRRGAESQPDVFGSGERLAGYPRDVTLPDGSVLRQEAPPRAILPAAAGSVDLVCALVPPGRIAALPDQALRYSGVRDPDSPYLARPRFDVYEAERVLDVFPDLVLTHSWQSPDTTARLREAGVDVVLLPDPPDWSGVLQLIDQLGELLDARDAAADLRRRCDDRLEQIRGTARGRPAWTALAYSHGGAGGLVAGAGTTNDEILRLAGMTNVAPRPGHTAISFEELLVLDPEVLLVGGAADSQQSGGTLAVLRSEPALAGLAAVAEDRIVVLEPWLYTTLSHHLLDAADEVLRQSAGWAPSERGER